MATGNLWMRILIKRDLPSVVEIDRQVFGDLGWGNEEFIELAQKRNSANVSVVEVGGTVGAYVAYTLDKQFIGIHRLAVSPSLQRSGIARHMLEKLQAKVDGHSRRAAIVTMIPLETFYVPAMRLMKSCGFSCEPKSVSDVYEPGDQWLRFFWRGMRSAPFNRIKQYTTGVNE